MLYVFNTCYVSVFRTRQRFYFVWKDAVVVGGMIEDSQLFNLAIPAPVLDGLPSLEDGMERRRKYCTQGLTVPLHVTGSLTV